LLLTLRARWCRLGLLLGRWCWRCDGALPGQARPTRGWPAAARGGGVGDGDALGDRRGQDAQPAGLRGSVQLVEPRPSAHGLLLVLVDDDACYAQRGVVVLAHALDGVEEHVLGAAQPDPLGAALAGVPRVDRKSVV